MLKAKCEVTRGEKKKKMEPCYWTLLQYYTFNFLKKFVFLRRKKSLFLIFFKWMPWIRASGLFKNVWVADILFCLSRILSIVSRSFLFMRALGEFFLSDHRTENIYSWAIGLFLISRIVVDLIVNGLLIFVVLGALKKSYLKCAQVS